MGYQLWGAWGTQFNPLSEIVDTSLNASDLSRLGQPLALRYRRLGYVLDSERHGLIYGIEGQAAAEDDEGEDSKFQSFYSFVRSSSR